MIRRLLQRLADRLPVRIITGGGDDPYLYKYLVWQSGDGRDSWRVHLHRFVRSDEDRELHNHPWKWAVSLVLSGGYAEDYRVEGKFETTAGPRLLRSVSRRKVRPGMLNFIGPDRFHRVDLLAEECWSLFVSGPIAQSWGFWSAATGEFTPWRVFVARKGSAVPSGAYWKGRRPEDG